MCAFVFIYINSATSGSLKYSVNTQKSQTAEIEQLNISSIVDNVTENTLEENWSMDYSHNIIIIPMADLNIPIEIGKPTVTLKHKEKGQFTFSEGKVRSVTKTPIVTYAHKAGTEFTFRPTLYISLPGFDFESDIEPWQTYLSGILKDDVYSNQYRHFLVRWDSAYSLGTQVDDLASVVGDFLNNKTDEWDVVIIGFSRGGIFAHELSKQIIGHNKINNLHTFLLDPTASRSHGDRYPTEKPVSATTTHFGSLYFDNNEFTDDLNMSLGTVSDGKITGYDNYERNDHVLDSTHADFTSDWFNTRFAGALVDIRSKKISGLFISDDDSGMDFVRIKANKNIDIDGTLDITDGNINLYGSLSAGGLSLVNIEAVVGADGVNLAGGIVIATGQLIINGDRREVSQSNLLSSYAASVSSDGLSVSVSDLFLGVDASINSDEITVNLSLGGIEIGGSADTDVVAVTAITCGICSFFRF